MRKLILTSFTAKTGDLEFTEQRLVVIESEKQATSEDDFDEAVRVFKRWFERTYLESELISVIPYETVQDIGEPTPEPKPTLVYVIVEFDRDNEISKIHAAYLSLEEATKVRSEMTFFEDEGFAEIIRIPLK